MRPTQSRNTLKTHIRASILLGVPLVLAQLAQMLITVIDSIMLGWLGVKELAAGTLAAQLFFIFLIFALGFGSAIMPLVSSALGRGEAREVRRSARMGLWILFALSVLFILPLWFTEKILILMGQEAELAALAASYMVIAQWSLIPAFLLIGLRDFLTSLGQAQIIMWFTVITAALNALLNYMFIFGNFGAPRLEMEGAAIATVIANGFALVITAVYVWRHKSTKEYEIFTRIWRADWPAFKQIARLGFPISLSILAEAGLFSAATIMIGWLGTIPLAAHGIALQIASMAFMVPFGLSQVATVRVGYALGQANSQAITFASRAVIFLALGFALCSAAVFVITPEPLIRFFLDPDDQNISAVTSYAIGLLYMAAVFQIVDGLQVVTAGILRGLSDTKIPMIIATISYWPVGLSVAWFLGFKLEFGGAGIWAGLASGLACAAILLLYRFNRRQILGLAPNQ